MAPRWEYVEIRARDGIVQAGAPVIISASRATDIPAFYADWFMRRLEVGYVKWINPFNGKPYYVSLEKTRAIVFWSKYPRPLFRFLDQLDEKGLNYYFTFTLNDYEDEKLEPRVPPLERRVAAFRELSERVGRSRVIWRFDPLILLEATGVAGLTRKLQRVGEQLHPYTEKLVISFADVGTYRRVPRNMAGTGYQEFDSRTMEEVARGLQGLNASWGLQIATCTESIDLSAFGIVHNCCIDGELMARVFQRDDLLMRFLGRSSPAQTSLRSPAAGKDVNRRLKDPGQRQACGCIMSKDIGRYDTCPHLCRYCYANRDAATAIRNYERYRAQAGADSEAILP
ncbi:MAG: DUF1848 domain-containing protein [Chloroflexota bacterium]|nr:MAG: DUF1848 domain-containing protein [Chloroflexota bacterium]